MLVISNHIKLDNDLSDVDYGIMYWTSGPDILFLMTFIFYFVIDIYNEVKINQSPPTKNTNIAKNTENTKK